MKKSKLKPIYFAEEEVDKFYLSDCKRIVNAMKELGLKVTIPQAYKIWVGYSDNYAAGFLVLPEDNESLKSILRVEVSYLREFGGLRYEI